MQWYAYGIRRTLAGFWCPGNQSSVLYESGTRHLIRSKMKLRLTRCSLPEAPSRNFKKLAISFVMSVLPFVRMEHLGSHWTDFHEILYLDILRTSVRKTRFSLKSDKNNRYFIWRTPYLYIGRIFMKICIWIFFEHLSGKLDFRYNRTKITGTLFEELHTFTLDEFSWNFIFEYSSNICPENSIFVTIGQK